MGTCDLFYMPVNDRQGNDFKPIIIKNHKDG